jgi:S-formylglutathione hydrolase FrmB
MENLMLNKAGLTFSLLLICCLTRSVAASQLLDAKLETKLVPGSVEYAALLPDGYEAAKSPLPLLLFLHGGGGDKSFLGRMRPTFDEMWKAGVLPPIVVITPNAARSFYMDYKDGSQKWETFIVTEFLGGLAPVKDQEPPRPVRNNVLRSGWWAASIPRCVCAR